MAKKTVDFKMPKPPGRWVMGKLPARPNQYALHAPATAALWFIDPLAGTWFHNLMSTHPTIERRIARLERLQHSGNIGAGP